MDLTLFAIIGMALMQYTKFAIPYYIALIILATLRVLRFVNEIRKAEEAEK